MSPAGHVITNYHVITDASDIQVTFMGGTEYSAKVVGFDQDKDIAVLQVGPKPGPALAEVKFDPVKGTATLQVGGLEGGRGRGSVCVWAVEGTVMLQVRGGLEGGRGVGRWEGQGHVGGVCGRGQV